MADSESSIATSNDAYVISWSSSDSVVISQMNKWIEALKDPKVEAAKTIPEYDGGCGPSIHMFGLSGNERCDPEVVSTWLNLLVTLASKGVTGDSLATFFPKSCGGCMVYSILMAVGCFHSGKNIQLTFDFFRHVLADPSGEILELNEVDELSSLLARSIPPRPDGTCMRNVCLELHSYNGIPNTNNQTRMILESLRHLIEGLGVLCTSKSFIKKMQVDRAATMKILKESITNKTFSYDFARKTW